MHPTNPFSTSATKLLTPLLILLLGTCVRAQDFTSYFTGNPTDLDTTGQSGVCLMGGASENDNAMRWFLERANGGDVLVLRTSGSDGYNDYMFSELGVAVNSVQTIVFNSGAAAGAQEVADAIAGAEAIWFAGGNQATYVDYWQNTAVDSLINEGIRNRGVIVGGTSAGMAILGGIRFTAENGTITSEEALANPLDERITLDTSRFIDLWYLRHTLTDTHFDNPDRRGRLLTFFARAGRDYGGYRGLLRGIACDEYTAVCIDHLGNTLAFGDSDEEDYAYFLRTFCELSGDFSLVSFEDGLTWSIEEDNYAGLLVQKLKGTETGVEVFEVTNLNNSEFGEIQQWTASEGILSVLNDPPALCVVSTHVPPAAIDLVLSPNPANELLRVSTSASIHQYRITDTTGRLLQTGQPNLAQFEANVSTLPPGPYFLTLTGTDWRTSARFMVIH